MAFKKLSPEDLREHKGKSFTGITTVFLCHDGNGNILLCQRSKNTRDEHGNWDVGAGGLKFGQSLEENLLREIKEEYSFNPKKTEFIGYMDAFRKAPDGEPTHWLAMYFAVLVEPSEFKINEPEMIDGHGWFSLDKLPSPMHSQFGLFFEKYGEKLKQILAE